MTVDAEAKLADGKRGGFTSGSAGAARETVSVVIAVHNAETTLPALLTSLAGQNCDERYEVIVADDASTDASVSVAMKVGH